METELIDLQSLSAADIAAIDGIRFGSAGAMVSSTPRQRDRRQAIAAMLAALMRSLDRRHDISLMRGVFEQTLRRVVEATRRRQRSRRPRTPEGVPPRVATARRVLPGTADVPLGVWRKADGSRGAGSLGGRRAGQERGCKRSGPVIVCRSAAELERLHAAGRLVGEVLTALTPRVAPGFWKPPAQRSVVLPRRASMNWSSANDVMVAR